MTNIAQNNMLFNAFEQQATRLAAKGATPADVARVRKFATVQACAFMGDAINPDTVKGMTNQKGIMRLAQVVAWCASGNVDALDPVTAYVVSCVLLTKQNSVTYSDFHYVAGGKGDENTTHIRGVSRSRLNKFLPTTANMGTVTSKTSRSVGKNGFLTALGVTAKTDDKHGFALCEGAKSNPVIVAFGARLESMTDGAFALFAEKNKSVVTA